MPRNMRRDELTKRVKAQRQHSIDRLDPFRVPAQRAPAASPVSQAVKVVDAETRRLIDEALAKKRGA